METVSQLKQIVIYDIPWSTCFPFIQCKSYLLHDYLNLLRWWCSLLIVRLVLTTQGEGGVVSMSPHDLTQIYSEGLLIAPFRNDVKNVSKTCAFVARLLDCELQPSNGCQEIFEQSLICVFFLLRSRRITFFLLGIKLVSSKRRTSFWAQIENDR